MTNKVETFVESRQLEFTEVFAENYRSIIDTVNPITGCSSIYGETLEQIRERYPNAQRIAFDVWQAGKVASQDTPIVWEPTTAERYDEMLNVLPPAFWQHGAFLVGEPWDHHAGTGEPRFQAFKQVGDQYFVASRPMTRREIRADVLR